MWHGFFATLFYIPLYNALVFLISIIPGHNAGIAVILLTIIIRLILFPLSRQAIKTQLLMKQIEADVQKIKEKITDRQEQAQALMKLYKENGINPFASFLLIFIQLPILIELYRVFRSGLPKIDPTILYSFVHAPATVVMTFLGTDLLKRSIILAIVAVITQFIQVQIALPKVAKNKNEKERSFQTDLAYSMNVQMRFILPLIMFPIAYVSAVVALYLIATNIFTILQELFVRKRLARAIQLHKSISKV
jgi:YidC/Oxa1 family membrane protein insertase